MQGASIGHGNRHILMDIDPFLTVQMSQERSVLHTSGASVPKVMVCYAHIGKLGSAAEQVLGSSELGHIGRPQKTARKIQALALAAPKPHCTRGHGPES